MNDEPEIHVTKYAAFVQFSCCAIGFGCEHEPVKITRRQRIRLKIGRWWDNRPRIHRGPCDHTDCGW